ncbi:hypothetical protein QVA66_02055 [Staphylococcus chromogenes]|nr:hypothetical protein [Staphylococcus chromogenes]
MTSHSATANPGPVEEVTDAAETSTALATPDSARPRFFVPQEIGMSALLFLLSAVAFTVGGGLWGWWRPAVVGTIADGGIDVTSGANAEFIGFVSYSAGTAVLGMLVGVCAGWLARRRPGLTMMTWAGFCGLLGSAIFLWSGDVVARWRMPQIDMEKIQLGAEISYVPALNPGISLAVGLYFAWLSYWVSAMLNRDETDGEETLLDEA